MIQTGNRNGFNFEWYRQTDKILRHRMDLTLSLDLALCFIRNNSSSVMGSEEKVRTMSETTRNVFSHCEPNCDSQLGRENTVK